MKFYSGYFPLDFGKELLRDRRMGKIKLTDTVADIMFKMSEGNPGAVSVLMRLFAESANIDPHDMMKGMGCLLSLDTVGIYGSAIYVLFHDKCDKKLRKLVLLLRAEQLGFIDKDRVVEMANDQAYKINLTEDEWVDIDNKVCERLPNFMPNESDSMESKCED